MLPWLACGLVQVPPETLWRRALERSRQAERAGVLVPLATELLAGTPHPFVLRRLLSRTPKHLLAGGPKPNPFLPWEAGLEVERLGEGHIVLLNKYPVQCGHLLLITAGWKPQSGWLERADWDAVMRVNADTSGLWFFNSCPAAGASQPHRHLQLLPRRSDEPSCPMEALIDACLNQGNAVLDWTWAHALSPRQHSDDTDELAAIVADHCRQLGLGCTDNDPQPRAPYNLLFTDRWVLTVRRTREHWAGFSLNALGFAGYLLATERSDLAWLAEHGPWQLLAAVAEPGKPAAPWDCG